MDRFAHPPPQPAPVLAPLACCVAAVPYAYPWDGLIARFKFRQEPGLAPLLATLMLRAPGFAALALRCDMIAPVPLSRQRLTERGYNQSWELIRALARKQPALAPRTAGLCLERRAGLADQHDLPRQERLRNLQDAFTVPPQWRAPVKGRRILLVDDVTTTGATLAHAAQALLKAGAASVHAAVVAATPDPARSHGKPQ